MSTEISVEESNKRAKKLDSEKFISRWDEHINQIERLNWTLTDEKNHTEVNVMVRRLKELVREAAEKL